jgi:two-component system, NarL family, nitrate/nitrite response regulator NarL
MEGQGRPIRVMLVDDHRTVLWGLEQLIESEAPRMKVIAKVTSCAAAIEAARRDAPDVVVLDLDLAGESGSEIIPQLINGGGTRVLILTGVRDGKVREESVLRGACGIVGKDESAETLVKAIEKVHCGELWLDRTTTGRVFVELSRTKGEVQSPERRRLATLTAREREVVERLVAEPGTDNRRLALNLHLGEHTLRNHLSRIYDKLGVPNRLELYVYAQRNGVGRAAT